MFLNYFLLVDRKFFFHQSYYYDPLFLQLEYFLCTLLYAVFSGDKTKRRYTPLKLESIK